MNTIQYFKEAILQKTAAQWVALADQLDLPLVRMAHFKDLTQDPQAWANDFVETVEFRTGRTEVMPTSPIEMASFQCPKTRPAPLNGADSISILQDLGYSQEEISAMTASGAVVAQGGKA